MLPQEYQDMIMQTSVLKEEKMKYETVRDHVLNLSTQRMQMSKPTPMDIGGLEGEKTGQETRKNRQKDVEGRKNGIWMQ